MNILTGDFLSGHQARTRPIKLLKSPARRNQLHSAWLQKMRNNIKTPPEELRIIRKTGASPAGAYLPSRDGTRPVEETIEY